MRTSPLSALLVLLAAGCMVGMPELTGKACDADVDCTAGLVCRAPRPGEQAVCVPEGFVTAPGGPDGGGGGGSPDGGGPPGGNGIGPYWCNDVENVLATYCAGCHGAPASGGAPSTFRLDVYGNEGGLPGARDKALRVHARMVETRTMPPPSAAQPTEEDRAKISAWIAAGAPECEGTTGPPLDGGTGNSVGWDGGVVSYAQHVQPLFDTYCLTCHTGGEAEADLMLDAPNSYGQLMQETDCDNDYQRVVPGSPASSILIQVLGGHANWCAPPMPYQTPGLATTAPEDFKVIEAWIQQGALNN